jgi:predicted RNase H-like nuclease
VAGIDGYGHGAWVAVVLEDGRFADCLVGASLAALLAGVGPTDATAIDMPIGLPDEGERAADRLARARVGARWPSVFRTPPRAVLAAATPVEANAIARHLTGKGVSRQALAIAPRIFEVERVLADRGALHEAHPEVSFAALAGGPLAWPKTSWRGVHVRRALLETAGIVLPDDLGAANGVPPDDVLDAAAAAWTADRIASGRSERLPDPPEVFSDGRPATINV